MSEPVAARVEDDTKQWLETKAEQDEITVSKLAGNILDNQSGDVNDTEPDSTEQRLDEIERTLTERVGKVERDITALKRHAEALELGHFTSTEICTDIELRQGTYTFPKLPGNDEGNVYGNGNVSIHDGSYKKSL